MKIKTTGFKDGKKNTLFACGMYVRPYAWTNQCSHLATALVTPESYEAYQKYWQDIISWNERSSQPHASVPPMMRSRLICDKHLKQLQEQLPDNPRERESE